MSVLRVISSPPDQEGSPIGQGGLKRRKETLCVFLFKGSVLRRKGRKNLGGEEVTLMTNDLMTAVSHIRDSPLCAHQGQPPLCGGWLRRARLSRCQSEFRLTCFLPCWLTSSQAQRYVSSLFGYNFHKSAKIYTRFGILFQINAYLCLRPNTVIYATMEISDDGRHPRLRHKSIHRLL